jgi:autotransporter-associated beta strand protein
MKIHTAGWMVLTLALVVGMLAGTAQAAGPYYWDNDGATLGFGTPAAGTWAAPTIGNGTQGWSMDSTGATVPIDQTTTNTDALNFGNGGSGLGAGTVTISGTVEAGDMTFASGSGAIVLSGGTITLPATGTITVDNTSDTISSILAGAATSLTKAGTGTLVIASKSHTYSGATVISDGTLSLSAGGPVSVALTNPSFETDTGVVNSFNYQAITGWTGGNGIEQGSSRTFAPAAPPNYNASTNYKWAFIQLNAVAGSTVNMSQTINVTTSGTYTVGFAAVGRATPNGPLNIQVQVDGVNQSPVFTPSITLWNTYSSSNVFLSAGSHTLSFVFINALGGDKSSDLDAVTVTGTSIGGLLPASTEVSIAAGATFDLNGSSQTIISLSDSSGSGGTVTNSAAATATLTINPSSGSTTFSGGILGAVSLVKSGIATQVLAGASAYAGGTTVTNGALLVSGSITGAVSVASGATLGGTGAITGNVTFATGALALFTNNAPLTFTGPVTLSSNTVHLALPDNLADGTYLLATNTTAGFTGAFALNPIIDSGSTVAAAATNIITDASAVRLIVSSTPIIMLSPSTLPLGTRLAPYSQAITASGGTSPYTNTVVAGSLPSGLTLSPEGLLSGTPDAIGTYNFTVQAMDALGYTGTRDYSVTIQPDAKSFFWINTASSVWSVAGNWNNDVGGSMAPLATGQTNYTLDFNSGTYTATSDLDSGFLLNRLNFGGATVTLAGNSLALTDNGSTLPQVNQNSAAAVAINNYLVLATNVTLGGSGGGALTLAGELSGPGSLTKTTSGTLTLSGNNAFTGGIIVNAGNLTFTSLAAGMSGTGKSITFNGISTLETTVNSYSGGQLSVNSNATLTIVSRPTTFSSTSGSGSITYPGFNNANVQLDLGNASAFTGTLRNNIGGHKSGTPGKLIQFTRLGDGVGSALQFGGGDGDSQQAIRFRLYGDAGSLIMASRQIQFYAKPATGHGFDRAILQNDNTNPANKWVIIPNLANTIDRPHYFELRGSNTGDNEFAGAIINSQNGGHALSLNKVDAGKWILSGTNTFSGVTTISGGTLEIGGAGKLGNGTYAAGIANTATLRYNSTASQTLAGEISGTGALIKDNNTGTLTLAGHNTYNGATTVRDGTLWGRTGGSCSNSTVTVINAPGTAALGVVVNNTAQPWVCASLTFSAGTQLKFSFAVEPSTVTAPLRIRNNLTGLTNAVVVVDPANIPKANPYPLLVAAGTVDTNAVPTLSGVKGRLAWGNDKTLYLTVPHTGTLLIVE